MLYLVGNVFLAEHISADASAALGFGMAIGVLLLGALAAAALKYLCP